MFDERVVIVLDLGKYQKQHQESVPFKAICTDIFENEIWVKSIITNREYEIYPNQILEFNDIEDIKKLVNLKNYGS